MSTASQTEVANNDSPRDQNSSAISLESLCYPLNSEKFLEKHFFAKDPYLSKPNPSIVRTLTTFEPLSSVRSLVNAMRGTDITLFGPGGFRSTVPAKVAMDFYNRGDSLYMIGIQRFIPGLVEAFSPVAESLGIPISAMGIEAFAGRAGAISTLHYDFDVNFQILLSGKKRWKLKTNHAIENPLDSNHIPSSPSEEALAKTSLIADQHGDYQTLETQQGSVLFFPLGHWHEVECISDSIAINLVIRPDRWGQAIAKALTAKMVGDPDFRSMMFGALHPTSVVAQKHAQKTYPQVLQKIIDTISQVSLQDAAVFCAEAKFKWSPEIESRHIKRNDSSPEFICTVQGEEEEYSMELEPEMVPLIEKIIAIQGTFTLAQISYFVDSLSPEHIMAACVYLSEVGYLINLSKS